MGFTLARLAPFSSCRWFPIPRFNQDSKREDTRSYFFERLAVLETGERDDHEAALALQRGESLPPPTVAQLEMGNVSFAELLEKFLVADTAVARAELEEGPSRTKDAASRAPFRRREQPSIECVVCRDDFECIACLNGPCGHYICRQCVITMAEVAHNDEGLFPLQCCRQPLPMDVFLSFLPTPLRTTFSVKCAEAATPPRLRVYCANQACSHFIGRSPSSKPCVMSCPECGMRICSGCKTEAHPTESCDDNLGRDVRALAKQNGWKTCPKCKMIIERSSGCAHMMCRCRQSFCYKCGSKWDKCRCRWA